MDSLSLYQSFCQTKSVKSDVQKYAQVDQMIAVIYSEIFTPPFETSRSPFLCETVNMLGRQKEQQRKVQAGDLSVIDVYVILSGLCEYIHNQSYRTVNVQGGISKYLFCDREFPGNPGKSMEKIIEYMKEIGSLAGEARISHVRDEGKKEADLPPQERAQSPEDHLVKRAGYNQSNIRKWHEEQEKMTQSLQKMQPAVRELLEGFLSLSDRITENYVLKFARQQVELYDLIADAYDYHKSRAEESGNEDYRNAVQNYEEYLYAISDTLAVFGVEEIISGPGTGFDGGIHEADTGHFSAKQAVVARSVRSGFRYKEIVIRKEKVKL